MAEKAANYGVDVMRMVEKSLLLQILDQVWKEHLLALDHLRQGIGLRAYGQRDPLNEYKREAFKLFEAMLERLRERVTQVLAHIELRVDPTLEPEIRRTLQPPPREMHETRRRSGVRRRSGTRRSDGRYGSAGNRYPDSFPFRQGSRSGGSCFLGTHCSQRPVPLRFRPQVQALPRPRGLSQPAAIAADRGSSGESVYRLYPLS